MGKKPDPECSRLEASIHLRCVALAFIHERRRLLALLRANAVGENRNDAFDAALRRLKDLELISYEIKLAVCRNPPRII
jgi:hypothetical protein